MSASADENAVFTHCRTTTGLISDGAARTIASWWWADDSVAMSFVTTGAVLDGVWNALTDRGAVLGQVTGDHRLALEKLHAYLDRHAGRGPVAGWSEVWVR